MIDSDCCERCHIERRGCFRIGQSSTQLIQQSRVRGDPLLTTVGQSPKFLARSAVRERLRSSRAANIHESHPYVVQIRQPRIFRPGKRLRLEPMAGDRQFIHRDCTSSPAQNSQNRRDNLGLRGVLDIGNTLEADRLQCRHLCAPS